MPAADIHPKQLYGPISSPMIYNLELNTTITPDQAETTVIKLLSSRFTYRTEEQWLQMINKGQVLVDGNIAKADDLLLEEMSLGFVVPNYYEPDLDTNYHKIFENENIIVVSKPADLPISTNHKFFKQNMTALIRRDFNLPDINPIHRLDRETSGLMIYLKKPFDKPKAIRKDPRLIIKDKYYLAIVNGIVEKEKFTVNIPLKDLNEGPTPYKAVKAESGDGKEASTEFTRLGTSEKYSLLLCRLNSGRKHQIRAHCAIIGHPIVGDKLYLYDGKYFIKRRDTDVLDEADYEILGAHHHLLHAYKLNLELPEEGAVSLKSEYYSEDFKRYLGWFGKVL